MLLVCIWKQHLYSNQAISKSKIQILINDQFINAAALSLTFGNYNWLFVVKKNTKNTQKFDESFSSSLGISIFGIKTGHLFKFRFDNKWRIWRKKTSMSVFGHRLMKIIPYSLNQPAVDRSSSTFRIHTN